jgi:ABC-type dipeptide/oligopeptide/nickel transport system permease component
MFDLLIEIYFLHLYFLYCTYWVVSSLFIYLLGAIEHKLFVASLNKQATAKEIEEIFAPYGHVEDVYIMKDGMRQSRGLSY